MAEGRMKVKMKSEMTAEEAYFLEQDKEKLRTLRADIAGGQNSQYSDEHKNHCFRCGTESLVEIDRGDIKIDICVNDNCGAIHLDPGELEQIIENQAAMGSLRKSFLSVFK